MKNIYLCSKYKHSILLFLLILLFFIPTIKSQASERYSILIGLDSVSVIVNISCNDKIPGFNKRMACDRLQTMCELELRNYGINIVSSGYPMLNISFVMLYSDSDGLVSFSTITQLYEYSMPERHFMKLFINSVLEAEKEVAENPNLQDADSTFKDLVLMRACTVKFFEKYQEFIPLYYYPTWSLLLQVSTVGPLNLESTLERNVKAFIREFINDYLEANPKE